MEYHYRHWRAMTSRWWGNPGLADEPHGWDYTYQNGAITAIRVTVGNTADSASRLHITWQDRQTAEWSALQPEIAVYVEQFGLSVSQDGRFIFVQTWDSGLYCLDAATGEKVWRSQSRRGVTSLAINESTLVAHQREHALLLLDPETGAVLKEKHPAKAWGFFQLDEKHLICQTTARQWEIIRTEDLETILVIPHSLFPRTSGAQPWCIRDVWLKDGCLWCNAFRSTVDTDTEEQDFLLPVEVKL